jgi:molybdopterin/thiamine biosynthesis adenylyltransferase
MNSINSPEYSRNYGFMNEAEQEAILRSSVAIAGVGGDGFQLGLKLARMGVASFDIADPEVFEPENSNRVPGASTSTYGLKKAEVFSEQVHDINPDASVRIYGEGVTEDNVSEFMHRATLVFDESELTYLQIGTAIAREARRRQIPDIMVMNIGFAAQITSFNPNNQFTFERFMGIPDNMPLNEVKDLKVDFSRCLPYIPKYADLRTLTAVQEGAPLPSISEGVDVASALGTSQAFLHIVRLAGNRRPQPVWAPRILWMDSYDGTSGSTRHPRMSHYRHLIHAASRQFLKINPGASYTQKDRARREQDASSTNSL